MKGISALGWIVVLVVLLIIGAGIYTYQQAALKSKEVTEQTNYIANKANEIVKKTVENIKVQPKILAVAGYAPYEGKISSLFIAVTAAQGSASIDLSKTNLVVNGVRIPVNTAEMSKSSEIKSKKVSAGVAYVLENASTFSEKDYNVFPGEVYTLGAVLPSGHEIKEGDEWDIKIEYNGKPVAKIKGTAPEVISQEAVVDMYVR